MSPKNDEKPSHIQLRRLLDYYQNGLYDDAEKIALSITYRFPEHPFGWKVLGAVFGQLGKKFEAASANKKLVILSPQDSEAHNILGHEIGRSTQASLSLP